MSHLLDTCLIPWSKVSIFWTRVSYRGPNVASFRHVSHTVVQMSQLLDKIERRCHSSICQQGSSMDRFIDQGYVIITKGIHPSSASRLAKVLRCNKGWQPVFGQEGEMDPDRMQCVAPGNVASELDRCFRPYWKSFFPKSEAKDWVGLRSKAGGSKQAPHTDFTFPLHYPHLDHANMPAGIIIALESGTHLLSYGWNRLFPSMNEEETVHLDVGDAIIFRGDLIHAGGAYITDNVRVHAYLDVVGVPRKHNRTNIFPFVDYEQGVPGECSLYNCNERGSAPTIHKHINRFHHARFSQKRSIEKKHKAAYAQATVVTPATEKKRRRLSESSEEPEIIDLIDASED